MNKSRIQNRRKTRGSFENTARGIAARFDVQTRYHGLCWSTKCSPAYTSKYKVRHYASFWSANRVNLKCKPISIPVARSTRVGLQRDRASPQHLLLLYSRSYRLRKTHRWTTSCNDSAITITYNYGFTVTKKRKKDLTFSQLSKKISNLNQLTRLSASRNYIEYNTGKMQNSRQEGAFLRDVIRYWRVKRVTNRAKLQSPNRCLLACARTNTHTHTHTDWKADRSEGRKRGG